MIFPQNGVRFIAINDGVDSAQGDNDFAPLRNIFNEWLVRDTSKKIKAVKRSKGMSGKPVTSKPVCLPSSKSPRRERWNTAGREAPAATPTAMSANGRQTPWRISLKTGSTRAAL